jgi:hypothetical protein
MSISENSNAASTPAIRGENTGGGTGVYGISAKGRGIEGWSTENYGVTGDSQKFPGVRGTSVQGRGIEGWSTTNDGVWGISSQATGVHGVSENSGTGVFGESKIGRGVHGQSETWQGVFGASRDNAGVVGESDKLHGVFGICHNPNGGGVFGTNDKGGFGVLGQSKNNSGVIGTSESGQGLTAFSDNDIGVFARGATFSGVFEGALVVNKGPNPKDPNKPSSNINGSIVINDGNLFVNKGDVILAGADCAEEFNIVDVEDVESGTVMVISDEGSLRISDQPYDKRVAGVISGAGNYKPGLILDRQQSQNYRKPIALLGKVYCKVDAQYGEIEVGDLLTTSATFGHAMKVDDPMKAFGAVIGKALRPLESGQELIPILIALQ